MHTHNYKVFGCKFRFAIRIIVFGYKFEYMHDYKVFGYKIEFPVGVFNIWLESWVHQN